MRLLHRWLLRPECNSVFTERIHEVFNDDCQQMPLETVVKATARFDEQHL